MIARLWHGVVPLEKGDTYHSYLKKTGLADLAQATGIKEMKLLRRDANDKTHYLLITCWNSFESIRQFAGDDVEKARYYPDDGTYLLEMEETVTHYKIVENQLW